MNELAISNKPIMFLGQKGIVKFSGDGAMQSMEIEVECSYRSNHFCKIPTRDGQPDKWIMTDEGLLFLAKYAGVEIIPVPTMLLNGEEVENPKIVIDHTGRKQGLHVRTVVGAYDSYGDYRITESIIQYNAMDEFLSQLLTKVAYEKSQKDEDKLGITCPYDAFAELKKSNPFLVFYPTDSIPDPFSGEPQVIGVAVNTKHKDFVWIRKVQQDAIKFSERKLQTVGHRNAVRTHPAVSVYSINPEEKRNENGEKIDLVYRHKIIKWLNVDPVKTQQEIEKYLKQSPKVQPVKYHDLEEEEDIIDTESFETPFDNEYEEGEEL